MMRESSGDLVRIQIVAQMRKVPKGMKISKDLLTSMVRHKADTSEGQWDGTQVAGAVEGEDPKGIKLLIIRWSNPERHGAKKYYRYAEDNPSDQADAWGSLRRVLRFFVW